MILFKPRYVFGFWLPSLGRYLLPCPLVLVIFLLAGIESLFELSFVLRLLSLSASLGVFL
jgi:hypothetical protein